MYIFMDQIFAGSGSSDQVVKGYSTNLFRFSLMLGKMSDLADANRRWKIRWNNFNKQILAELFGNDGEPVEFEWNIFLGRRLARAKH